MVVLGTKPEYFNAVWVKNEWSRYLNIVKESGGKKVLIPAYKDMDPYDLPEEFSHLQAQDMGKLGFMQDLIRGITKVLQVDSTTNKTKTVVVQAANGTVEALLQRGFLSIEDQDWSSADDFFEQVLNIDAKNASAYWGKFLVKYKCQTAKQYIEESLSHLEDVTTEMLSAEVADESLISSIAEKYTIPAYLSKDAIIDMFSFDDRYKSTISGYEATYHNELQKLTEDRLYCRVMQFRNETDIDVVDDVRELLIQAFQKVINHEKQVEMQTIHEVQTKYKSHIEKCENTIADLYLEAMKQRDFDYQNACTLMDSAKNSRDYERVILVFNQLDVYKDSVEKKNICQKKKAEYLKKETEDSEERKLKKKKKDFKIIAIVAGCLTILMGAFTYLQVVYMPSKKYEQAMAYFNQGVYEEAQNLFKEAGNFKDAKFYDECISIKKYLKDDDYENAKMVFKNLSALNQASTQTIYEEISEDYSILEQKEKNYERACKLVDDESPNVDYQRAIDLLTPLKGYKNSNSYLEKARELQKYMPVVGTYSLVSGSSVATYRSGHQELSDSFIFPKIKIEFSDGKLLCYHSLITSDSFSKVGTNIQINGNSLSGSNMSGTFSDNYQILTLEVTTDLGDCVVVNTGTLKHDK